MGNEISIITKELIDSKISMSPNEFIMDSIDQIKIRDLEWEFNLKAPFCKLIIESSNLLGIKHQITNENLIDMKTYVLKRCKNLSIEEIAFALQMERYGDFGEKTGHYHNFNADYLSTVINKYKKWKRERRIKCNLPIGKKEQFFLPQISELDKNKSLFEEVMVCYNYFLETKSIKPGYIYVYNVLDEIDEMPKDINHKKSIYLKAKKEVKREIKTLKSGGVMDRISFIKMTEDLESGRGENKIIVKAKEISLKDYFTKLEMEGKNIIEILKDKYGL